MRRAFAIGLALLALPAGAAEPAAAEYAVGQVWSYQIRPADQGSLLRIAAIEESPVGAIYHVSLVGIKLTCRDDATEVAHLPVSAQTLRQSLTAPSSSATEFPAAEEGIAEWRMAEGGVFTISVAEIANVLEQSICRNETAGAGE